jgi:hypothetical protein
MFIMDLCVLLHKTREELLDNISSKELSDWQIYFRIKKYVGEDREDYRNAQLCTLIATVFSKKGSKINFTDFIPGYERVMPKINTLVGKLRSWVAQAGAKRKVTRVKREDGRTK